jgi:anti-anti-sigma factor
METANLHKDVTTFEQDGRLVIRVDTPIMASNAGAIVGTILSDIEQAPGLRAIILDLGYVTQMDSSGVGVLVEIQRRAERMGIPLAICSLQEGPRRMLGKTRLDGHFRTYSTVEAALADATLEVAAAPRVIRDTTPIPEKRGFFSWRRRPKPVYYRPVQVRRSRSVVWGLVGVLLVVLVVAGAYCVAAVEAYRGRMNLLPAIQDKLIADGRRIDDTKTTMRNLAAERAGWRNAQDAMKSGASRDQIAAELNRRATDLQTQIRSLSAEQQTLDAKLFTVEDQLRQLQSQIGQPGQPQQ